MSGTPTSLALPPASSSQKIAIGGKQYIRSIVFKVLTPAKSYDLSELHIKFAVTSRVTGSPRTAFIRVYNLSDARVKELRATGPKPYGVETGVYTPLATPESATIILEAGYVQNVGGIFAGGLVQTRSGRESPTETYLDFFANDQDTFAGFGVINITIPAGTTDLQILNLVVQNLQQQNYPISVAYTPPDLGGNKKSIRAQTLSGKATDFLRIFASKCGCTWHIISVPSPNGFVSKIYLVPYTGTLPNEVVILSSGKNGDPSKGTGLVGYPQQTENGINARCLLNPILFPSGKVQIDQEEIQAAAQSSALGALGNGQWISKSNTYKIIHLVHRGDTRGQEWYSDLIGIDVDRAALPGGDVVNMDVQPTPGT
jgi:hypothetical protein